MMYSRQRIDEMAARDGIALWLELGLYKCRVAIKDLNPAMRATPSSTYWEQPIEYYFFGSDQYLGALYTDGRQIHLICNLDGHPSVEWFKRKTEWRKYQKWLGPKICVRHNAEFSESVRAAAMQAVQYLNTKNKDVARVVPRLKLRSRPKPKLKLRNR